MNALDTLEKLGQAEIPVMDNAEITQVLKGPDGNASIDAFPLKGQPFEEQGKLLQSLSESLWEMHGDKITKLETQVEDYETPAANQDDYNDTGPSLG